MKRNRIDTLCQYLETKKDQEISLIPEEAMKGESEQVKNFLRMINKLLIRKTPQEREIFLNKLQNVIEENLKGSEEK